MLPPVGVSDGQPIDLLTSGSINGEAPQTAPALAAANDQPMPGTLPDGWVIQIGASPSQDGAQSLIDSAGQKLRTLAQYESFVQRFEKNGQVFYRARFGGFTGQDTANDICKQLKQVNMSCLAMQS